MLPPCHFALKLEKNARGPCVLKFSRTLTNYVSLSSLSSNNIGDAGAKDIAAALKVNTSVTYLE